MLVILLLLICTTSYAQKFTGINALNQYILYEGQRFLMNEVYEIDTNSYDKLKIQLTISDTEIGEGFMFVLTSYKFNNNSGVVITSFNSTVSGMDFENVHLSNQEFENLNNQIRKLSKIRKSFGEHHLKNFNDNILIDISFEEYVYYQLWINGKNRHTFTSTKWDKAIKKHSRFLSY